MRVVSLSPAVSETLSILGAEDELVGVTPWCLAYLRSKDKPIAGTYLHVDPRLLERLRPDVVFLQSHVHDGLLEPLRGRGFKAYLVPLPANLLDIASNVHLVSTVVGRYWEGKELADSLVEAVAAYARRMTGVRERPRVYVEFLWPDGTFSSAGALTYVDDAVRLAGGRNVFADRVAKFFSPSDEEILSRDPEVVLVNVEPQLRGITVNEYLGVRKALARTSASRSGRVHLVVESPEVNLAHPGPSFITRTMGKLVELVRRGRD